MKRWIFIGSVLSFACNSNPSAPAPAPTTTAQATSVVTASAQPAITYDDADLPVPADFEDEAEKTITAANYKDELEKIESELGGPDTSRPVPR